MFTLQKITKFNQISQLILKNRNIKTIYILICNDVKKYYWLRSWEHLFKCHSYPFVVFFGHEVQSSYISTH